jgi:hypothetical protein
VPAGFERRAQLIATDPRVFYLKTHYEPYPVVLVRLDCIDRNALERLLRSAHRAVSTSALVPVGDERREADVPRNSSRPAGK